VLRIAKIFAQIDLAVSLQAHYCLLEVALRVQKIDPLVHHDSHESRMMVMADYELLYLLPVISKRAPFDFGCRNIRNGNAEFLNLLKICADVKTQMSCQSSVRRRISGTPLELLICP
jgi:hypothetical protein